MFLPLAGAGECEYGTVNAWARTVAKDGSWGEWRAATVHDSLLVGEPFQVKVEVTPMVNCTLSLWLLGAGSTKAYEVISGSTSSLGWYGEILTKEVNANRSEVFHWMIRPTANWSRGIAALNVYAQFTAGGTNEEVKFTIIAAYIKDKEWREGVPGEESDGLPGMEVLSGVASLLATAFIVTGVTRRSGDHG